MALPTTVVSSAGVGGHQPAIKSSAGNVYVVVKAGAAVLDVYKATDPATSFSVQDAANNPVTQAVDSFTYKQDGGTLHIISWDNTAGAYYYHQFNMVSDVWVRINVVANDPTNDPTNPWASITVLSDGEIVVVLTGDSDKIIAPAYERVDWVSSTDGGITWSTATAVDAAGENSYGNINCVKAPLSDDIHINFQFVATASPPANWDEAHARTLSAGILSTVVKETVSTLRINALPISNMVVYDDASTQRIAWVGADRSTGINAYRATVDGSDDIVAPSVAFLTDDIHANGEVGILSLAEDSGVLYMMFSGGGAIGVDQDIYYTKSTDDGATWDTPTEEVNTVTCNYISINIFQRGDNTVLAYRYDDGGVIKYGEKNLSTGLSYTQLDHATMEGLVNQHTPPFEI